MTLRAHAKGTTSYLQHPCNKKLLQTLGEAERPIAFKEILESYGTSPPVASVTISIYEATNLGLVKALESESPQQKKVVQVN
jgi:hypothetical protein